jgi:hypothetical protein
LFWGDFTTDYAIGADDETPRRCDENVFMNQGGLTAAWQLPFVGVNCSAGGTRHCHCVSRIRPVGAASSERRWRWH